uniref:Uncharacterized protein n=1 Tax=Hanusia phi TaxID=3032 RepID=A0A7S0EYH0_9CRYP|mmetsp:Transcript_34371/g.77453  ORF Transcript_34371/g.77453 Transcript_34371/m.77453 type:complete len:162 (+) Transcript_34371:161-646(+)
MSTIKSAASKAADILRDEGDSNGKGRGATKKIISVALFCLVSIIIIGVITKTDDPSHEQLSWGDISISGLSSFATRLYSSDSVSSNSTDSSEGYKRDTNSSSAGGGGGSRSNERTLKSQEEPECTKCQLRAAYHLRKGAGQRSLRTAMLSSDVNSSSNAER